MEKCFLYNIFGVFMATAQPAREVVGRRQERCDFGVKPVKFLLRGQESRPSMDVTRRA